MRSQIVFLLFTLIFFKQASSQTTTAYKTWNPALDTLHVLEGQAWPGEGNVFYNRLSAKAELIVRKDVWDLSKNTAGLKFGFITNADEIIVKYIVTGSFQMVHMPATGVSGIDLYAKNSDGNWLWSAGDRTFGDTVVYHFNNLPSKDEYGNPLEYTLYLPLYNSVKWMEIIVPHEAVFTPLPARKETPVVVYGTSIAQGACASRPGHAWTNMLSRKLDRPLINLGFSGNGKLEPEVLDLVAEVDAKLYVLDCLPNLIEPYCSSTDLKKRIAAAVVQLQSQRPKVPILLTEHAGYSDEAMNAVRKKEYQDGNTILKEVFDSLSANGVKNIYLLTKNDINQDIETLVDFVHPNDIGMMRYAEAYDKKIREIINEPVGNLSTMIPVTEHRDAHNYDWQKRHNEVLEYNKANAPQLIFMGNSITHFWGGKPTATIARGVNSWQKYFAPKNAVNLGFGWDRIENVLWRVYHGELDSIAPKQIIIMIGTNNFQADTDEAIVKGLQFLIKAIQTKQPTANILLMGILPRRNMEARVSKLNAQLFKIKFGTKVRYADAGKIFLQKDRKINESLFSDGLHPNVQGYDKLGEFINEHLRL